MVDRNAGIDMSIRRLKVLRIILIAFLIILMLALFLGVIYREIAGGNSETYRRIHKFYKSSETHMPVERILGSGWERMCVFKAKDSLKKTSEIVGRDLGILESIRLTWMTNTGDEEPFGMMYLYESKDAMTMNKIESPGSYEIQDEVSTDDKNKVYQGCFDYKLTEIYKRKNSYMNYDVLVFKVK